MFRKLSEARFFSVLLIFGTLLACGTCTATSRTSYDVIAARILATYQQALPTLPLEKQKHFCLRMYRLTGDTAWLPPVISDLHNLIATLKSDRDSLIVDEYYRRRIDSLAADFARETRKSRSRRVLFEGRNDIRLQLDWLYRLSTINDYQIADSTVLQLCQETKNRLEADRLVAFLLDTQTISVYAAQAANAVEYLSQLGLTDIRRDFYRRLLEVFPDSADRKLDDRQFGEKVYGLTHIIISASGYYQHTLDRGTYAWILDYFSANSKRIVKRLPADIISEVGVCFLLCDDTANILIDQCRQRVAKGFDSKTGLIQSPLGNTDLATGEHRNILAYMLLRWSGQLWPGPTLQVSVR